jgi:carbonic anhydrase/acetyltransferase-like protein (isoleucine patch superfamily)
MEAMRITHDGVRPTPHPDAYVSPAAVLSGDVHVGAHSRVLHGAVLTAEGGPVTIGEACVVMEGAVLRSTRRHPLTLGDHVLVGPNAYLTGCRIEDEVFVATGAMVFNGAVMRRASSVALGGAVHIGCQVPAEKRIPIGWVAVGDPARLYPPTAVEEIRTELAELGGFLPYVFGTEDSGDRGRMMRESMARYVRGLARHREDVVEEA